MITWKRNIHFLLFFPLPSFVRSFNHHNHHRHYHIHIHHHHHIPPHPFIPDAHPSASNLHQQVSSLSTSTYTASNHSPPFPLQLAGRPRVSVAFARLSLRLSLRPSVSPSAFPSSRLFYLSTFPTSLRQSNCSRRWWQGLIPALQASQATQAQVTRLTLLLFWLWGPFPLSCLPSSAAIRNIQYLLFQFQTTRHSFWPSSIPRPVSLSRLIHRCDIEFLSSWSSAKSRY